MKSALEISAYWAGVMKTLLEESKIPLQIAGDTGISQSHISNVLRKLKEHGPVGCINPEARRGREVGLNLNILDIT